jgi:hypothetical protein
VPQGYFQELPAVLMNRLKSRSGKVVTISSARRMMRYAAAAAVIGAILLGGWLMMGPAGKTTGELASTDKEVKEKVKNISDEEILNYANSNTLALAELNTAAGAAISEKDAKDLLADVSDEELQHYLEEHGASTNSNIN